jgi:hypothetical protein
MKTLISNKQIALLISLGLALSGRLLVIRDTRVEDPTHVKEGRDLSILPPPAASQPAPSPLDHEVEVQARPLSFYQEVL